MFLSNLKMSDILKKIYHHCLIYLLAFFGDMKSFEFPNGWQTNRIDVHTYLSRTAGKSCHFSVGLSQPPQSAAAGQPLGSRLAWTLPTNCSPSSVVAAPSTRLPLGPLAASTKAVRARREGERAPSALSYVDVNAWNVSQFSIPSLLQGRWVRRHWCATSSTSSRELMASSSRWAPRITATK